MMMLMTDYNLKKYSLVKQPQRITPSTIGWVVTFVETLHD